MADKLYDTITQIGVYLAQHNGTALFDTIMESQCAALRSMISKLGSLQPQQATQLTEAVNSGPWTSDSKHQLLSAIAQKLSGAPSTDDLYQHLEDNFAMFLPEKVYQSWQTDAPCVAAVMQDCANTVVNLGIFFASEQTKGHVVKTALELANIAATSSEFFDHLSMFKRKYTVTTSADCTRITHALASHMHCIKLQRGCTFVIEIKALVKHKKIRRDNILSWQYSTPDALPNAIVEVAYRGDKPHGQHHSTAVCSFNMKGCLRRSGSAVQRGQPSTIAPFTNNMPMQNQHVNTGAMDMTGGMSPMMQSIMQQMAAVAYQQVQQQLQQSQPDNFAHNLKMFSPAPRVRQRLALPDAPDSSSAADTSGTALPAGMALEEPSDDTPPKNDDITAEEAARIIQQAMTNAAGNTAMKKPAVALKRPAATAKAAPKPKAKAAPKATVQKAMKATKKSGMPATIAKRIQLRPNGCSKCRYKKPGCHPSCW